MRNRFFLCIALALSFSTADAQTSLRQIKAEEDTLQKHVFDIVRRTLPMEEEYVALFRLKYKIPKTKRNKLAYFINERERRKACYNYIYNDSINKRVRCKLEIDSIYRDSINTILIPVYGNKISGDNISHALRISSLLRLDEAQYQYLMDKAVDMARRIYTNPRINVWNEEINILRNTLSPEQLSKFFFDKNAESVTKEVDEGWQRIVAAGLSEKLDSAKDIRLACLYYHNRQKIKDIYRYYGTSKKKYLAELDLNKPQMVKILDALDKEKEERPKEKSKTVGKEFVW